MTPSNAKRSTMSPSDLRVAAAHLSMGQKGDSILARINPKEAQMLESMGGVGKRDEYGITQYYPSSAAKETTSADADSSTGTIQNVETGGTPAGTPATANTNAAAVNGQAATTDAITSQQLGTLGNTMFSGLGPHGQAAANIASVLTGNPLLSGLTGKLADAMSPAPSDSMMGAALSAGTQATSAAEGSSDAKTNQAQANIIQAGKDQQASAGSKGSAGSMGGLVDTVLSFF